MKLIENLIQAIDNANELERTSEYVYVHRTALAAAIQSVLANEWDAMRTEKILFAIEFVEWLNSAPIQWEHIPVGGDSYEKIENSQRELMRQFLALNGDNDYYVPLPYEWNDDDFVELEKPDWYINKNGIRTPPILRFDKYYVPKHDLPNHPDLKATR